MLTVHESGGRTVWVDLWNPTHEELARACTEYKLDIPPREELEEIEFSSRLQYEDDVFIISVPLTPHHKDGTGTTSPLGFVLTKDLLVTVRFARLHAFEAIVKRVNRRPRTAPDIFMVSIEALIDFGADRLEELRTEALHLTRRIFHDDMRGPRRNIARMNRMLRTTLVEIGDMGERVAYIRDTMLVLQRAVPFVLEHGNGWLDDPVRARLKMAASDVQSLNDYEVHLSDKLQFLLDATLGFSNIEQNDIFKVLTIASVVGIPPVLIAGIYGMNFHNMPELGWSWGYPFGLFLILLSTVLPIVWFKWRGWW